VKRIPKYFLIALLVLVLISAAIISVVVWALNAPEGTRVLMKTISVFSPVRIDAREISGRLGDELNIRGLRVRWLQGELLADFFHLRWEAAELLSRRVVIREISLDAVQIKDGRPDTGKTSFPGWPQPPFWISKLQGQLDSFRMNNMLYQRGQEDPVRVNNLSTILFWDGESLRARRFSLDSSRGHAEGSMEMGFAHPRLSLNLQTTLAKEFAGSDSIAANLSLQPVENQEKAKGSFLISGQKKGQERLHCEGDLGLTRAALGFQNLRLFQPGRRGMIQAEGEMAFSGKPKLWLKAMVSELDLAPELGRVTDLSGKVEIQGSVDHFKGQATFISGSEGWSKAHGSAAFRGNLNGLEITNLEAAWLDGSVKGPLKISWVEGISIQAKLQARRLNPSILNPQWKGELNLDLEGKFLSLPAKTPEASFKAGLLASRFFERVFTGELEGIWQENLLNIIQLRLRGRGFDLQGKGIMQEKFFLEGRVTDLSGFIPDAKGEILATGWVRYWEKRLTGMMKAEGKDLSIKGMTAGDLRAVLHLKEYSRKTAPLFSLESRAAKLKAGPLNIPSVDFKVDGTSASHWAQFTMALSGAAIQGRFAGAYKEGSWKGTVKRLGCRDARGPWNLQAPARVTFSVNQFQLSPVTLKSARGERLRVHADLTLNPTSGAFRAEWQNVDLARANPWRGRGNLSGQSSGALSADGGKNGWQISGKSHFKGAFAHNRRRVEISSGKVDLNWHGKGLLGAVALKFNPGGTLEGRVSSAEAFQLIVPREGKFEGHWKAIDLGLLQSLFPNNVHLKGKNSGNVSGAWSVGSRFELAGKMGVTQGHLTWKGGPKPISINLNKAKADFAWRGEEIQGNLAISSIDHGNLKGRFLLPFPARFSLSFNPDGPLKLSLRGQIQERGILPILYPEWIQKSRAKVDLDLQADGTWGNPRFKGILRISDAGFQIGKPTGARRNGPLPSLDLELPSASATVDWGPKGLLGIMKAALNKGGKIEGKVTSSEPARVAFPRQGEIDLLWTQFNLLALQPFLPEGFLLEGQADGKLDGAWFPDFRLDMAGRLKAAQGKLSWQGEKGLIDARITQAGLDFRWAGERVQGNVLLSLTDYGSLKGKFRLPLPARLPFRFDPAGPVQVSLQGKAQEKGLLATFFPGVVEESRGNIDLDLMLDGTWAKPNLQGTLDLTSAGAHLPTLGIRVEDLSSRWKLRQEQIQVESLRARCGPGRVEGAGTIWLKRWEIDRFEGNLKGEKFQTLYLPNLQIQSSPRLQLKGTPQHISVRGEILLPEVHIYEVSAPGVVRASSDVVTTDPLPKGKPSFSMDIQVRVILGDRIQVKAGGIDARLAGNLDLKIWGRKPEEMSARGEIRLAEGFYSGYGLSLRVDRGRFIYAGGPVDNPELDILALRRSDDLEKMYNVKVGVAIFGSLKKPNVKLYSQPAMKEEEILSYLVLGRPYDPKEGNLSLLLMGAGGLLAGDSINMLDQLKSRVGIDTVDIQSGGGDFSRSMITIGKYLTPQLYVSYGYSVFNEEQVLKVRYRIAKNWEVETWRGTQMGADLYYRIDFY
jgi:autotransporter translocation and assembly factor TamB